MLANNSVLIIMIVMSYLMVAVVVAAVFMHGPRSLDQRKQRQVAKLIAGAEVLADALSRKSNDSQLVARLQAQYDAHVSAIAALGGTVPAVVTEPAPLANAA